ncbi:hypothetical protein D1BOALGB6SA_6214 [Olavius sp. associated proteobacterium Delta 1]|nr:hypothetical protein D1BOALGB6SA_6214 [Olavius sp. associated proteobacterium Delta 1]
MAQGGELVEPFEIWFLVLEISLIYINPATFVASDKYLFKWQRPDNLPKSLYDDVVFCYFSILPHAESGFVRIHH